MEAESTRRPNQRWCWDINYLMPFEKGVYLYLCLLLDEWFRKVIQWRLAWHQTAEDSRLLLEGGLTDQNILDLPADQRPEGINKGCFTWYDTEHYRASTTSPRSKSITTSGRKPSIYDAPSNLLSAAGAGKNTKSRKPAPEEQTNINPCPLPLSRN